MRIDRLRIENFKGFENKAFEFLRSIDAPVAGNGSFHVMIGRNGTGKTSVLDALAVALGFFWHKAAPGTGWRNILAEEIRLLPVPAGDRIQFRRQLPCVITAEGRIGPWEKQRWQRFIRVGGTRTTNTKSPDAELAIAETVRAAEAQQAPLPVMAYYGAGRAWSPTNKRPAARISQRKPQQFDAYRDCLNPLIHERELNEWFLFEAAAMNGGSEGRPGYRAVKQAVLQCIPEADNLRYESSLKEIVLSIHGFEQPFYNLSAGQRMMLALVADIAIKAVTLNSYLLGPEHPGAKDPLHVLRQTPGVVLIDELDVHLHPQWQRRVVEDLRRTFPEIQFIATTHSPFIVQTLREGELIMLEGQPIPEVGNHGIDEIARGLMGVTHPETNERYFAMRDAAKNYLLTLEEAAVAPEEKLQAYLDRLAQGIDQFADNPAYQAFLELKREGKLGARLKEGKPEKT